MTEQRARPTINAESIKPPRRQKEREPCARRFEMANESKKCKHPSCDCTVSGDDDYCSEYCRDARDTMEIGCGCEHPPCR